MIRLGLRLSVAGGREAIVRLGVIAAAIALGVGLLLTMVAGLTAVTAQNQRYAWLETGFDPTTVAAGQDPGGADGDVPAPPPAPADPAGAPDDGKAAVDPLWWQLSADTFEGKTIGRVDVATTGPDSPLPPGVDALPGPGQYVASPAMQKLLAETPDDELAARYGSPTNAGTIGDEALPSPATLVIIVGRTPAELSQSGHAVQVTSIATVSPDACAGETCAVGLGMNKNAVALVFGVVGVALVIPILVFIGAATRLSAARREQRLAAMRLVGATPRQVRTVAAMESVVAAAAGTVVGFGVFLALRPLVLQIPLTGSRFQAADYRLSPLDVVLVLVLVPVAAAVASRFAMRRVVVSPLGVSRRTAPKDPSPWRLVPFAAGLLWLAWLAVAGPPSTTGAQLTSYLGGIAVVMVGLVVAGPWLTRAGSRLLAVRTGRPTVLLAGRRLGDDPRAAFRSVSGLILALFVGTVATGTITSFVAERGPAAVSTQAGNVLVKNLEGRREAGSTVTVPGSLVSDLSAVPGVSGVAVVHTGPDAQPEDLGIPDGLWGHPGYVSCDELATLPTWGTCSPGADVALVAFDPTDDRTGVVWPTADVDPASLGGLDTLGVGVQTDGSTAAIERSRTIVEAVYPGGMTPYTVHEEQSSSTSELAQYQRLAEVIVAISLVVGGCSLAVSAAGSVNERKRPFSLLRLTGVPLGMLRRVITLETAVPLLAGAVVAVAAGFGTAQLFLAAQLDYDLTAVGGAYWASVGIGLVVGLGVIASTFPLLRRVTGPETARND
ncbi:FtsX-like permease family protein [Luteimicrobium sp. NPDC057192]|uniref:FtsX-like permease family protein n=1 Tax=Luteimicrobium sp. NPDC057192 TaxID=3346042 RepID=UPI003637BD71